MKTLSKTIVMLTVMLTAGMAFAKAPSGVVTFTVTPAVTENTETVTVWLPYPMSDAFQTISHMEIKGNYGKSAVYRDPSSEAVYFFAAWDAPVTAPQCTMQFHIDQKNRKDAHLNESQNAFPAIVTKYLKATEQIPADDAEMKAIAKKAVKGKTGTLEKAKGIYDWVVEHTYRDPNVKGCGLGLPVRTLNQCSGGGKCADLSTVFVTLARAAGIPARDVYGLRLSSPKDGDVTSGFHCWAEFYLQGTGWVMVDPADVRKMMLVHKLNLEDADTDQWRDFFWGGDDLFRVVLEKNSRGVSLNGADQTVNYFMYPAAQVDGTMLNYFDAAAFSYKVEFKQDRLVADK